MRKLIAIVLSVLLIASLTAVAVFAASEAGDTTCDATLKGYQNQHDGYDVRFVAEVNHIDSYTEVGFIFSDGTGELTLPATHVFKTLLASFEDGDTYEALTAEEGKYLYAVTLTDIPADAAGAYTVTPYTVDAEETIVRGDTKTVYKTAGAQFTAATAGETAVTGTVTGDIEVQTNLNTKYSLTGHDESATFAVALPRTVTANTFTAAVNGTAVTGAAVTLSDDGQTLYVPKALLGDARGNVTIAVTCGQQMNGLTIGASTEVTATLSAVDMILKTADDLDAMQTIADDLKADADASYALMSGYFVLGNDIAYNRTFHTNANAGGTWSAASNSGFTGTFDGRGHVIDGMTMGTVKDGALAQTRSGFFPSLVFGGTIKNVVFTNAVHEGYGGFVSSYARVSTYFLGGTIENVYVHLTDFTAQTARAGVFSCFGGVTVKNCVAVVDQYNANGQTLPGVIAWKNEGTDTIENAYVISPSKTLSVIGNPASKDGLYANWSAFAAATLDFTSFDATYWNRVNGIVFPKKLAENLAAETVTITNTDTVLTSGSVTVGTTGHVMLTVASEKAGVTISDNVVTLPASETRYTVTVTATALYDASKTATWSFTVAGEQEVDAGALGDIEMQTDLNTKYSLTGHDTAETFTITLTDAVSAEEFAVTVKGATVSGAVVTLSEDGKTLTLPKSIFGASRGDVTFKVTCISKIDGVISQTTGITATATAVDMIIRTADDLDQLQNIADALQADTGATSGYAYMSGYFVLGNDIAYNRTFHTNANAGGNWSPACGFSGTFDGRGHVIDGMTMGTLKAGALTYTRSGLFPALCNGGTIKNVVFTNAVHEGYGGFVASFGAGTVENVYVHLTSFTARTAKASIFSTFGGVTVKNCVAVVDQYNANGQVQTGVIGWKNETDTIENVYAISPATGLNLIGYNVPTTGAIADGVYASWTAFAAAELNLTGFDTSFWKVENGIVYPKTIAKPTDNTEE